MTPFPIIVTCYNHYDSDRDGSCRVSRFLGGCFGRTAGRRRKRSRFAPELHSENDLLPRNNGNSGELKKKSFF
jgi:hypothetical protein